MKSYNLLDPQDFQRAVEESGLDIGVLRAIRFGMVYGNKPKENKNLGSSKPIRAVDDLGGNVVNLTSYRIFRGFKEI